MTTQIANRIGQTGIYRAQVSGTVVMDVGTQLPGMQNFADAIADGQIAEDVDFVALIKKDDDNWQLRKAYCGNLTPGEVSLSDYEIPANGTIALDDPVSVTMVLSAAQLIEVIQQEAPGVDATYVTGTSLTLPYSTQIRDVISIAYNASPVTVTLDPAAPAGYSALLYMPENETSVTFESSGGQSINGGGFSQEYSTQELVVLVSKDTATSWRIVQLITPNYVEPPYTEIVEETASILVNDDFWGDESRQDGPRYTVLDTALLANSSSPMTITLGGGSLGYYRVFDIVQTGSGAVTIAPDAGFTVNGGAGSVVISAQWKKARVYFAGGTEFFVVVDAVQGAPGTELNLITSSADADITAAAGNRYVVDASGYTANRTLTLPTGAVGDRVSVAVTDIANDYSLIITGTGTWGTGEWSRLISVGETVDLLCHSAGSWMVSNDGRIPAKCSMAQTSAQTGIVDGVHTQLTGFATASLAVGVIVDESAGTITAKRDGMWSASVRARLFVDIDTVLTDGAVIVIALWVRDGEGRFDNSESLGGDFTPTLSVAGSTSIAAGESTTVTVYVNQIVPETYETATESWNHPYISIVETL